nr:hypothetical protein [Mucilaginibacter celer]
MDIGKPRVVNRVDDYAIAKFKPGQGVNAGIKGFEIFARFRTKFGIDIRIGC